MRPFYQVVVLMETVGSLTFEHFLVEFLYLSKRICKFLSKMCEQLNIS